MLKLKIFRVGLLIGVIMFTGCKKEETKPSNILDSLAGDANPSKSKIS